MGKTGGSKGMSKLPDILNTQKDLRGIARGRRREGQHEVLPPTTRKPVWKGPRIGLALGGGGAKGFAHIVVLETLDELGITPVAIAGTSIGAIIGAAYAAGHPGAELRRHVLDTFRNRTAIISRLVDARVGRIADLFTGFGNPVLLDGEKLLERFWPAHMPQSIEELALPFTAVSGDLLSRTEVRASSGPLFSAVAGSMAIPGLVRAQARGEHLLVDGYTVNPVPVDALGADAEIVIAVDLGAAETRLITDTPKNAYEALLQSILLMQHSLTEEKFRQTPPDIRLTPDVGSFSVLDFMKVQAILKAAEPLREELKRRLDVRLLTGC